MHWKSKCKFMWFLKWRIETNLLKTSFTTTGFSLISFGNAAITSFFVSPFSTGIRNRTSDTRVWYRSRTRATNSALGGAVYSRYSTLHRLWVQTMNVKPYFISHSLYRLKWHPIKCIHDFQHYLEYSHIWSHKYKKLLWLF